MGLVGGSKSCLGREGHARELDRVVGRQTLLSLSAGHSLAGPMGCWVGEQSSVVSRFASTAG